ncbi:hypothetical protein HK096_006172 [Nowakowskiella sp. JEL0078]|nr:hypothetical protein HK096_006172 [Nowakowskiella sp. JEL0078]
MSMLTPESADICDWASIEPGNTVKIEILTSSVKFQPWLRLIEGLLSQKGVDHCIKIKYANEVKNKGQMADEATITSPVNINERVKGSKGEKSNAINHINAYCNKRIGSSIEPDCIFALNALQAIKQLLLLKQLNLTGVQSTTRIYTLKCRKMN